MNVLVLMICKTTKILLRLTSQVVKMLLFKIPHQRKVVSFVPAKVGAYDLGQHEYLRRDRLIQRLAKEAPYKYGEVVRPVDDEVYKQVGCYTVVAIMSSWYAYKGSTSKKDSEVEWTGDNPRIVQALSKKNGTTVEATVNYFKLATKEEIEHAENTSKC